MGRQPAFAPGQVQPLKVSGTTGSSILIGDLHGTRRNLLGMPSPGRGTGPNSLAFMLFNRLAGQNTLAHVLL